MFTDGLDHSALQWITLEEKATLSNTSIDGKFNIQSPASNHLSKPPTREPPTFPCRDRTSNWGLPASQLPNIHLHSGVVSTNFSSTHTPSTTEELEESVGSISGGLIGDSYDTEEEQDSGQDSRDSSFPGSPQRRAYYNLYHRNGNAVDAHSINASSKFYASAESLQTGEEQYTGFYYDNEPNSAETRAANGKSSDLQNPRVFSSRTQEEGDTESEDYSRDRLSNREDCRGPGSHLNQLRRELERAGQHNSRDLSDEKYSVSADKLGVEGNGAQGSSRLRYPTIELDDLCFARNLRKDQDTSLVFQARKSNQDIDQETSNRNVGNDGSTHMHARNWQSESDLKFEEPSTDSIRRSRSDSVGLPPSAPPMLASMVIDPLERTQVPVIFASAKPSDTEFVFGLERPSGPTDQSVRSASGVRNSDHLVKRTGVNSSQCPPVYLSGQAAWQALIAYDACVRLCLGAWARGCAEAPEFLQDECALLRDCFGLQQLLLQPLEEAKRKGLTDETEATAASKPKKSSCKLKIQVRKVKMLQKISTGCSCPSLGSIQFDSCSTSVDERSSNKRHPFWAEWSAVRKLRVLQRSLLRGSASQRSIAYVNVGAQYMRQVSGILKDKVNSLRSNVQEGPQEGLYCLLKLKSSTEEDEAVRMQPGTGDTKIL